MISASSAFKTAMNAPNRAYIVNVMLTRNNSTTRIDISDRILSYTCTTEFESRSGRLELEIDNYDFQLSPLNRESSFNQNNGVYDPLLDSNHKIELFEGLRLASGTIEYVKKFEGYLGDDINASSTPIINVSCRDKAKLLQDKYIYQGPSYYLYLVEDVIQDLLDTFAEDLYITLRVQDRTNYMIGKPDSPYTAQDTNLWDAISMLADSASKELRFLEDGSLVLRKIDRDFSNLVPSLYLTQSQLISDDMSISDADVRNHIVIKVEGYNPITRKDLDSIEKYGDRYMEVQRGMSDIITDVSQAYELADSILRDLKFANPSESSEIPLHPLIQVGDIVSITNPRLGTNTIDDIFKVVIVSNSYSPDRKRTALELQGFDRYVDIPSVPPRPPIVMSPTIKVRAIQNYTGSGWTGYTKEISSPVISWTPPSTDIEGGELSDDFGGYILERSSEIDSVGNKTGNQVWSTLNSIPSFLSSTGKVVTNYYDYSVAMDVDKYQKQTKDRVGSVTFRYRLTAINEEGIRSTASSIVTANVPVVRYKTKDGVFLEDANPNKPTSYKLGTITATTAAFESIVTSPGGYSIRAVGYVYKDSKYKNLFKTVNGGYVASATKSTGKFTGLAKNTTYYWAICAQDNKGRKGPVVNVGSFKTPAK